MSDPAEAEIPSFTEAQQAWIERLVAAKLSEATSTTATVSTDTSDSSAAPAAHGSTDK